MKISEFLVCLVMAFVLSWIVAWGYGEHCKVQDLQFESYKATLK